MRSEPTLGSAVAGAAVAGAAMAGAGARGARRAKGRTVVAAQPDMEQGQGLSKLTALAQELLQRPSPQQLQRLVLELRSFAAAELQRAQSATAPAARAKACAEVAQGAEQALRSGVEGQLRWAASAAAAMLLSNVVTLQPAQAADVVNYSDFLESVNRGDVEMVRVQQDMVSAQYTTKDGSRREVNLIPNAQIEDQLFNQLADKKVDVVVGTNQEGSPLDFLRSFAGPLAWLIAGLLLLFGGPLGGPAGPGGPGGNPFELGKAKARIAKDGETGTKFADVAGCDGAKQELVEVVDFLKNTSRYSELGAKIPKGALLVGPPGTGKTLLAKAVAGEAGVPFFSIAASEFVEVFAGVGASRVRDLFEQAKKSAPCIIFIDEIDAVGRQRSAGFGQGNDEREQTVNQLLTEMDGFEANKGVVVIAATNRADILDQALVRPGRFDRQIQVDPPDVQGRTEILKVHAKGKNLAPGVDLTAVARMTPGMSGADLANLLNEGAIVAARENKTEIDQDDIANALERIAIGLEKKDAVMSEKKKRLVAYHEAGHAILGALMMNDYDVVAKISIVPRGPAGGVTIFTPSEDRLDSGLYTKEFLENRMCVALGGRLAEEIINGKDNVTTGASNDFQQCTQVAKQMVMSLGMSPAIGQRLLGGQQGGGPFMGRDFMGQSAPPMSQALKQQVDDEVKRIVDEQYKRGMKLLTDNMYLLDELAKTLMEQEKVGGEELVRMINKAAIEGKLVMAQQMATAAYIGEAAENTGTSRAALPAQVHQVRGQRRPGFCGSRALPMLRSRADRSAVARYGLATEGVEAASECTSDEVLRKVQQVADSQGTALPEQAIQAVAASFLVALASTAAPMPASAEVPASAEAALPDIAPMQQAAPAREIAASPADRVSYSNLLQLVDEGQVDRVDFYDKGRTAVVSVAGRQQQLVAELPLGTGLINKLLAKQHTTRALQGYLLYLLPFARSTWPIWDAFSAAVCSLFRREDGGSIQIEVHTPEKPNPLLGALGDAALPLLLIGGLLYMRSRGPGTGGIPGMNQKAQIMMTPETGVKFEDVAGIEEAKQELTEIVDFLRAPERFVKVGAKIPRGVLLSGPPGTGKTLMAKALAGEAKVPFIQASASEFIELFVGVGASRVRDIFKQAKENSPCIVFIDELDAIGRQRGAGMGGGNDEREQTLNQILTEMDGFEGNSGVIVVAATNRADILDQALLRPGRFDRRVTVGLPDVQGREQILNVHVKNKKLAEEVTLLDIAKRTAGFSGADLENLMNESAILAARRNKTGITMQEINDATDRVIAGLEGRAMPDSASKKLVAYHEAGHALVGTMLPYHDPVNKVTLIPRGQAKGLTWFTPGEDQSLISAAMLKARIAGALGGRAAEQLVFGTDQVTTGASGDLQQVERMARAMVTQFGMSQVGSIAIDEGGMMGPSYSEALSSEIDGAVKAISDECYLRALTLLAEHRAVLDKIAQELCEVETMSGERLKQILEEHTAVPEKLTAVCARGARRAKERTVVAARPDMEQWQGLSKLTALAQELLQRPSPQQLQRLVLELRSFAAAELQRAQSATAPAARAKAFAEVAQGAEQALRSGVEGQLRWAASAAAAMLLSNVVTLQPAQAADVVNYSDFLESVNRGDVEMVRVQQDMVSAQYTTKDGSRREVNLIPNAQIEDQLFNQLADKKVDVVVGTNQEGSPLDFLRSFAGPLAWLIAGLLLLFGGPLGGPAGPGGPGGPGIAKDGETGTKFADVAGCDGAKQELVEVVDFLKNTSRYSELGAKIPKGALLVGPPGTGKTLLAKAVAGEAGVPFFSIAASEFVEVFAGVGASRVRDLFEQAKKRSAPCIIFIDEIDAVGRQRSAGFGQGNDERALVRPGRFDRQIQVDPPDVQGRTEILKVHAKGKNLAPGVDLTAVARMTPGMSGADLANLLNEGAIVAARENKTEIDQDDIANALERIAIGLEKKDAVMSEKKKRLVAYHEAGHAILGALMMNDYDVVAKISIVPRGPAGGVTIFTPSEDRLDSGLYTKEFLENRMCVALGGRLAEEIINGKDNVTTGASNDFQQCTQVAKQMVMSLGMSPAIGQRLLGGQQGGGPFMGRDFMGQSAPPMSQALKQQVDDEVKRIVDEQYKRGMKLLTDNMYLLDELAKTLMEQEKVGGEELVRMINKAAIEGKLVMAQQMATAAYIGEAAENTGTSRAALPAQVHQVRGQRRPGFCGSRALPMLRSRADRSAVARYGLATEGVEAASECTSDEVLRKVQQVADSQGTALPEQAIQAAAASFLVALASTAAPIPASAEVPASAEAALPDIAPIQQAAPAREIAASPVDRVSYSNLLQLVDEGQVDRVDFYDKGRTGVVSVAGRQQQLVAELPPGTGLINKLLAKQIQIEVHTPEKPNPLLGALGDAALPLLLIGGLLYMRSRGPGTGGIPGMNQKAQIMMTPETGVKFEDVAGIEEAKQELTEIVDFLRAPERFVKVGAKIPRGVLLSGPPGTGKTLMAKALAGEAKVPFIQASASEFIELFVGVGASRVRDIFKQAKDNSPCIVFIDELDAIGRQRGAGMGGGNDEREQTLNQILTEMDGFEGNSGVIVVAATNRADILDQALLRPGRFDRRVTVGLPDVQGREQILNVHVKNKKLAEEVTLLDIAKRTAGFSGADLENLMNESAILAARRNKTGITMQEINDATDRVIAGLEGRAMPDSASKKLVAYHEAGHALVGTMLPYHDPVNKVTLIPRGQAKGLTWFTPGEDQSLISAAMLKARIAGALGGRAAEQLVFGTDQVTTGASGDLQQVERMARAMVTQFGMSQVGSIAIDEGGMMGPSYSEALSSEIDGAVKAISDECYLRALTLLAEHRAVLDKIAQELCEVETMSGERLKQILEEHTAVPEKLTAV
ncbi:unnamed protein product [Effrenium voratum]|nr:unnamed protein product [Effrenium voratum]